jgi:EAL domain-containing protein (putative c-di-GMP-specific phosphodiesterase class I)
MLRMLGRQLKNLGLDDVALYERGAEAVDVLERRPDSIGVVFCDLQMPEMDGVEFVRHLVRIGYIGSLVLVSGEEDRILQTVEKLARAHQLRVLGALHKPISPAQLEHLLGEKLPRAAAPGVARRIYEPDELRRGIEAGELENHYQPKVALSSGALIGVETLVRWRHPKDGLVFPDQFISTAEEHGIIEQLTRAVLVSALRQARLWNDAGLRLHVSVNVSMDNLAALEFPDFVVHEADAAGVPVSSLVLEVTESRLMRDPLAALDILTRLRLKRIRLSIDDFGTGHSSLAQLRDIPFDELKVDRGFVHGAWGDDSLRAIVEASLNLAQKLGMTTVAEGIEDQADWDYLQSCGCDLAQGYFIAKPMRGPDLTRWLVSWQSQQAARQASTL